MTDSELKTLKDNLWHSADTIRTDLVELERLYAEAADLMAQITANLNQLLAKE